MRRIIYTLISLILFTTLSSTVNAQNNGLKELYNIDGVTSIYVSKSMLSLVKDKSFGHDDAISSVAQYLDAIEIFNSDNNDAVGKAKNIIDKFIASSGLEILTKIKDGDENVLIMGKSDGTQFIYLLMLVEEPGELTLINMTGKIPLEKISELYN